MSRFEVQGSGSHWAVLDGGRTVASFAVWWKAEMDADRRKRKAMARRRPCLCCGQAFDSEGPHNRLCDPCRKQ